MPMIVLTQGLDVIGQAPLEQPTNRHIGGEERRLRPLAEEVEEGNVGVDAVTLLTGHLLYQTDGLT